MFKFDSDIFVYPEFMMEPWNEAEIKNEPMLFNCSYKFARGMGGPITANFLDLLCGVWTCDLNEIIIDSRVHMLMKDWWPAIPGYHHDDVPRSRKDGQPNYVNPEYKSEHIMCLLNGDICPTEFALGKAEFPEVPEGELYYRMWHPIVEQYINEDKLKKWIPPSGRLIWFNWQTWHQATQAVKGGWRWFIRVSRNTNRKPTNEIRRQVQVYLTDPFKGW